LITAPVAPATAAAHKAVAARRAAGADISGYWAPRIDSVKPATSASLTPAFVALSKNSAAPAPGITQEYAERWCIHRGLPSQMFTSGPIDILQTRGEVGIAFDVAAAQRYIYTDGRKRPAEDVLDGTTNGFSIGHWEGKTLVVDTAGFSNLGVRAVPGGGWRGEKSHLVERFNLTDGGKTLTVTQTWTDPTVYSKPHVLKIVYDRLPATYSGVEVYCDGVDPSRAKPTVIGEY
jgi:hypothetical protein